MAAVAMSTQKRRPKLNFSKRKQHTEKTEGKPGQAMVEPVILELSDSDHIPAAAQEDEEIQSSPTEKVHGKRSSSPRIIPGKRKILPTAILPGLTSDSLEVEEARSRSITPLVFEAERCVATDALPGTPSSSGSRSSPSRGGTMVSRMQRKQAKESVQDSPQQPATPTPQRRNLVQSSSLPNLTPESASSSPTTGALHKHISEASLRSDGDITVERPRSLKRQISDSSMRGRSYSPSPTKRADLKHQDSVQSPMRPSNTSNSSKTYGAQRSLVIEDDDIIMPLSANIKVDAKGKGRMPTLAPPSRESYLELRSKWAEVLDGDDDNAKSNSMQACSSQESQKSDLRDVTSLISHGDNKRFDDDLAYMLEGLQPSEPLGLQRSTAVDLLQKTQDPAFLKRLRAKMLLPKVCRLLIAAQSSGHSRILTVTFVLFIAYLSQSAKDMSDIFKECQDISAQLIALFGAPWLHQMLSPAMSGLPKAEKALMQKVLEIVHTSGERESSRDLSLQRVLLEAMANIAVISIPGETNLAFESLLSHGLQAKIEASLLDLLREHCSAQKEVGLGKAKVAHKDIILHMRLLEDIASLDEALLLSSADPKSEVPLQLSAFLQQCRQQAQETTEGPSSQWSIPLLGIITTLKIGILLINAGSEWHKAFREAPGMITVLLVIVFDVSVALSKPSYGASDAIPKELDQRECLRLDTASLILGFLTSILESDPSLNARIRQTDLCKSCHNTISCSCACGGDGNTSSGIQTLCSLYVSLGRPQDAPHAADFEFTRTYAGNFLAMLMTGDEDTFQMAYQFLEKMEGGLALLRDSILAHIEASPVDNPLVAQLRTLADRLQQRKT